MKFWLLLAVLGDNFLLAVMLDLWSKIIPHFQVPKSKLAVI